VCGKRCARYPRHERPMTAKEEHLRKHPLKVQMCTPCCPENSMLKIRWCCPLLLHTNHAVVGAGFRRGSNFGGALRVAGGFDCEVVAFDDLTSSFFGFFFTVVSSAF